MQTSRYPNTAAEARNGSVGQPANRELQIPVELTRLAAVLDEHEKAVAVLSERVRPLLRDEPPSPAGKDCEAEEMLAPLANQVRSFRRQLERINAQVHGMVNRCEA